MFPSTPTPLRDCRSRPPSTPPVKPWLTLAAGINVHNAHSNVLRGNVLVGNEGPQVALDEGDAPACVQCGRAKRRYFARSDPIDIDVAELVPLPRKGRPSDFKQLCHMLRGTGRCALSPAHFQKV